MAASEEDVTFAVRAPAPEDWGLEATELSSQDIKAAFAKAAASFATPAGEDLVIDPDQEEEPSASAPAPQEAGCTEGPSSAGLPDTPPGPVEKDGVDDQGRFGGGSEVNGSETGGCGADKGSLIGQIGEEICGGVKGILGGLGEGLEGMQGKLGAGLQRQTA